MPLRKLLSKWHLRFKDAQEEDEYNQVRLPLLTDFSRYIFIALTGLLIPYSVRYFIKDVFPQNYIIIALILGGVIVFFLTRRFKKFMELILISYMILILSLFTTVFKDLLPSSDSREAFYMGYAFAMIHRLIGYRVIKFQFVLLLYIFSIAIKFPMLPNPDTVLTIIIVVLDLLTVLLSLKSERVERALFDNLYKSKKDIMKFKQLITQYLPNQMAIFASDYSETYYINNSFKRSFKCQNTSQVKEAIERYVLEKETIAKHKNFFTSIGCLPKDEDTIITLSYFINCVSQNLHVLQDIGIFSFPVIEDPKNDILQLDENQIKPEFSDQKTSQKNSGAVAIDMNESYRSSDRGTSKSHSSDFQLEEGMKRVYRVKMFPLEWDETDAIAMVLDDITQQKVIMELKIADKNKDLVIAMVSHELRTPLNGMLGLIDIARKNLYQTDVVSYLNACKNNGVLMLNLINSILDMNQVRNNKLRLVYSKISIRDFLNETKCLFDYFCLIKNLTLNMEVDPKVPKWLTTDKNRLSQILVNLLGNAFKFTFKGGVTVRVTLESSEPCRLKMSVEDTGIGIKKEDQDRLFKMYGKLEQQDKNINTNGVGLGLTISNMLAMLLNPLDNRRIQVESEVGKGTSFSFVILSQTTESMSKQEGELTLPDTSSHVGNDDKESNLLKKMSIYTINNKENYSKLISSRQNIESRKSIFAEKPAISYSSREAIALTEPNSEDDSTLKLMKSASLKKENSQYTKKDQNNMKIEVQYQKIEEEKDQDLEFDKTSERPWCLVVDDNPFNLMVACHIMEEKGYLVKTGLNGEEAIQRVLEHHKEGKRFKVVLMDCQMPIMDGYEATRRIREMMKAGEVDEYPIVALTANNRDEEHDKLCEEVGMSGHVSKPLQVDELEGMLKLVQK